SPAVVIENLSIQVNNGEGGAMKNISGSFNNSDLNQTNIQGEQTIETNYGIKPEVLEQLIWDINSKVSDENERDKALFYVEQAKDALKQKNTEKAKKMFHWTATIVGNTAAMITIGTTLGIL